MAKVLFTVKLVLIGFFIEFIRKKWDFIEFYGSGASSNFFPLFFFFFFIIELR